MFVQMSRVNTAWDADASPVISFDTSNRA